MYLNKLYAARMKLKVALRRDCGLGDHIQKAGLDGRALSRIFCDGEFGQNTERWK